VVKYGSAAGEDPFVKVKALITDLIAKLEAEGSSEADEKAYCDDQMAKTEEKKGELEFDVSKLTSKIDVASSRSAALKEDVKELQASLASLAKEQSEMDQMRTSAHALYIQAKSDLEAGLQGVRQALSVLREYYGGSGASMIQGSIGDAMSQPATPEYHTAASGAGSGIIGMLEVVESDFATGLASEETAESDSQTQYEKVSQENAISKTTMGQDVNYKTKEFKGLDKEVSELVSDRETTNTELEAVLEYYAKIKERCIAKPETYEERKRRREAEISGLKEALDILESETAFTQRARRAGPRGIFLGLSK
jgi:predicted  nucleic acid-binding Zn-ribbon protein